MMTFVNAKAEPRPSSNTGLPPTAAEALLLLIREAADPILFIDAEGRLVLWSNSAATLLNLQEAMLGQPAETAITHPDIRALLQSNSLEERREVRMDNGRTFNATLTTVEAAGQLLTMQEVTQFKEMERARTELVIGVAHDLRTPLTAVQGYVELLERVGPLNETQRDFVQRALTGLHAIADLIDDLLDIGQLESGYTMVMHRLDIAELLLKSCCTFRPIVEEAGLTLRCHLPTTPIWIMGNAARLRQVVENLLSNAIKYNRPHGWIALSAYRSDEHVIVSVADSGIGIPPQEQNRIFQRFYRIRDRARADIPGSGLGLAIVKAVVEQHGGRVWVESSPGEGSVFSFILPLTIENNDAEGGKVDE